LKEIDLESLAEFNGKTGKPVYIAYQSKIFDVTKSALWEGGLHMNRHQAACELNAEFNEAPHGVEVFERYPQVGILKQNKAPLRSMPVLLAHLIDRFPSLEKHPHPMMVHFPIVFLLSAVFFDGLYVLTDGSSFKSTALHCMICGLLFLPVTMLTGWFTWWLNYLARPMKPVAIKIVLSSTLLIIVPSALVWRIMNPGILDSKGITRILYLLLTLYFVPLVSITGWLGASLTFPIKKK